MVKKRLFNIFSLSLQTQNTRLLVRAGLRKKPFKGFSLVK